MKLIKLPTLNFCACAHAPVKVGGKSLFWVAPFRIFFGVLFFLTLYIPSNHLAAQVSLLQSWTNLLNSTSNSQNIPFVVSAGTNTNRLLVVAVTTTLQSAANNRTISLTYGGRALAFANGDLTANSQQHTAIYYLTEAELDLASGTTLAFNAANGNTRVNMIWAAVYDFVNQTTPINNSRNYNSGTTTVGSFQFSTALSLAAGNVGVLMVCSHRTGSTSPRTVTIPTNWSIQNSQSYTISDAISASVAVRPITAVTTDVCATVLGGPTLASMTGVAVNGCTQPTVNAGAALSAICRGGTSAALGGSVGGSAMGGTWTDGGVGGTFSPSATTLNATYTPPGAYSGTVTLTLTSSGGSCGTTSASKTLLVNPSSPASVSITSSDAGNTICSGTNVTFTATPTNGGSPSYQWQLNGSNVGTNSASYSNAGLSNNDVVRVVMTSNATCATGSPATSGSITTSVNTRPVVSFTAQPGATACTGADVTYTTQSGQSNYVWGLPGTLGADYSITSGGGTGDNSVTLKWLTTTPKTVTINYTNSSGCNASAVVSSTTTSVSSRPTPTFTAQPGSSACQFADVTYTTQSGQTNYTWVIPGTLGNDYFISSGGIGTNTVTLQWLTTGIKTVSVNYSNGACSALSPTSSTGTDVSSSPNFQFSYPLLAYCKDNPGNISVSQNAAPTGGTYSASPAGLNINPSNGSINIPLSAAGNYTVTYTLPGSGCPRTITTGFNIRPLPTMACPANITVCANNTPFILNSATPLGGTYSGAGVTFDGFNYRFNPAVAGNGTKNIQYSFTDNGCTNTCNFNIIVSDTPNVSATTATNYVYSGDFTNIGLSSSVAGAQFTWTATCNNTSISGFSSQATPVNGPIVQQLFNSSPSLGEITYTITPRLASGCAGTPVSVVVTMPSVTFCQSPGTFQKGSCIIDMGVTPQSYNNAIKPYGLIYELLNTYRVPVYWVINSAKTFVNPQPKTDQVDMVVDGISYRGGPFVVPAAYLAQVQSVISNWVAQGVVVRYSSTSFSPPVFELLTHIPRVVLDARFGAIVESGFYSRAGIPTTAYIKGGIPSIITNCDDIYVLPHAEPQNWTQAQRDSLLTFINQRGWLFSSCYAVSYIENLAGMNFLSTSGLVPYNNHGSPTVPFSYSTAAGFEAPSMAADPFMQFTSTIDNSIVQDAAFEKIYLPRTTWRPTTRVAVYKSNFLNNSVTYPTNAGVLVYGRAFGQSNKGVVTYLSGHDFEGASLQADNVAKARVYASFLLRAGIGTRPNIVPVSIPSTANAGELITLTVSVPPTTSPLVSMRWQTDLGGIFGSPDAVTTSFTVPGVEVPTLCTVQFKVIDACGRYGLYCATIQVNPTIRNNFIGTAQTICSGTAPATLFGSVPRGGAGTVSYKWVWSTAGPSSDFADAPGINNGKDYTPPALTQVTWFRRQATIGGVTVFSSPIQISITQGPAITQQPSQTGQAVCQGGALSPLSVSSSEAGVIYQWYSNNSASNVGGVILSGRTNSTFTPSSSLSGTTYYFATVTGSNGCVSRTNPSGAITIFSALQIIANLSTQPVSVCENQPMPSLTIATNVQGLRYDWYSSPEENYGTATPIPGASGASYTPPGTPGTQYYFCVVSLPPGSNCPAYSDLSNWSGAYTIRPIPTVSIINNTGNATITCAQPVINVTAQTNGTGVSWNRGMGGNATVALPDTGTYRVTATGSNGCTNTAEIEVFSGIVGATWTGQADNNWHNPANWCGGVPDLQKDVTLPAGMPRYPLASTATARARSITLPSGSQLNVQGVKLQVAGNINSESNLDLQQGTLELVGNNIVQSISGKMFRNNTIGGLVVSNALGVNLLNEVDDSLRVGDSLSFGNVNNVNFFTGDNLILLSDSVRTARVADITNNNANSGNAIIGQVTVQRFIPGRRAWRLLTVPLKPGTAGTINNTWQEGVVNSDFNFANNKNPSPGYGMHISGSSPTLGFDPTPMNNPSVKIFNPQTGLWDPLPNTLNSSVTDSSGYMVFVRGNRGTQLSLNTAASLSNTRLRAKGELRTGTQVIDIPATVSPYAVVGNPFASPVDFRKAGITGNVNNGFMVWDPRLGGSNNVGAYQYITRKGDNFEVDVPGGGSFGAIGSVVNMIQSGQAVIVQHSGAARIILEESSKSAGANNLAFRPANPDSTTSLLVQMSFLDAAGNATLADGVRLNLNDAYTDSIGLDDFNKAENITDQLAIWDRNRAFAIRCRPMPLSGDSIQLQQRRLRIRNYRLFIKPSGLSASPLLAELVDRHLNTRTPVNLQTGTTYEYAITSDSGAWNPFRFYLLLKPAGVVPVRFIFVDARAAGNAINVGWRMGDEEGVQRYEVQRSANGTDFVTVGLVSASAQLRGMYTFADVTSLTGTVYYRIRAVGSSDTYSRTVLVKSAASNRNPEIVPNPVTGGKFFLYPGAGASGDVELRVLNASGQCLHRQMLRSVRPEVPIAVVLPNVLPAGMYTLELVSGNSKPTAIPFVCGQ